MSANYLQIRHKQHGSAISLHYKLFQRNIGPHPPFRGRVNIIGAAAEADYRRVNQLPPTGVRHQDHDSHVAMQTECTRATQQTTGRPANKFDRVSSGGTSMDR